MEGVDPPLCVSHIGGRVGPKVTLNDALIERVVQLLRSGNYIETAAAAVNVGRSTFYGWLARGEQDDAEQIYKDFRERVDQARAEGEARAVAQIAKAAGRSWQAAAWMLERQYPERWARASQRQDTEAEKLVDPFLELDELAPLRAAKNKL